jgi:hypothetical protein
MSVVLDCGFLAQPSSGRNRKHFSTDSESAHHDGA